jgi:TIR domain
MPLNVFISYRDADSGNGAGRIADALKERLGGDITLFMDVDSIPAGEDFLVVLDNAIRKCDLLLAVIGSKWLDLTDDQGNRRVDQAGDFVRNEIAIALERNIPVIPVMIDGAKPPKKHDLPKAIVKLADYQGVEIRTRPFNKDIAVLIEQIKKRLPKKASAKSRWGTRQGASTSKAPTVASAPNEPINTAKNDAAKTGTSWSAALFGIFIFLLGAGFIRACSEHHSAPIHRPYPYR